MLLQAGARQRVAVIVNENARGVGRRVIDDLSGLVAPHDLYVSSNLDHSRQIAAKVVERAYDTVLFGGGDGTFVQCLSDVAAEARRRDQALPSVGVLRLGTGNALADCLGASRPTLRRPRARPWPRAPPGTREAPAAARGRRQADAVRRLWPRRPDPRRLPPPR